MLIGCGQQPERIQEIEASRYEIDSSLSPVKAIDDWVAPYRHHVDSILDRPLSFAPKTITKSDGERNTSLGNLMADIVKVMTDSLTRLQNEKPVDMVLLNHGGIRGIISKGPVNERTSYALMPFENTIFIQELSGETVAEMVRYLVNTKSPHPFSGMRIALNARGRLDEVSIGGIPLDQSRTYRVATSSYLVAGGDNMNFFKNALTSVDTGYKIRNALTDYFKLTDTLTASVDDRFTQKPGK